MRQNGWRLVRHYTDERKSGSKIEGRDDFQKMMRDAANGEFDVLVPYDAKRFARDGVDILNSAKTLRQVFNVSVVDTKGGFDNRDSRQRGRILMNYVSAGVAEDERLSILERTTTGKIASIKKHNGPANGKKPPFGRIWDKGTKTWSVDPVKQAMIEDAARRYLAGEPVPKIARDYGINASNLHKVLTKRCGPIWEQTISCPELGISETIKTQVPPLLPEETIRAILMKVEENTTYKKGGGRENAYLPGRMVFCGHCSYAMFGHTKSSGRAYYRHAHHDRARQCSRPKVWALADELERAVFRDLFDLFGNPAAVQRAVEAASPDQAKVEEQRQRLERLRGELEKAEARRERVVAAIADGVITNKQARAKLEEIDDREKELQEEITQLNTALENVPTARQVEEAGTRVAKQFLHYVTRSGKEKWSSRPHWVDQPSSDERLRGLLESMTFEDKRSLAEMVFCGITTAGGDGPRRMGVYVYTVPGQEGRQSKTWHYRILGRLVDCWGTSPKPAFEPQHEDDVEFRAGGALQQELLDSGPSISKTGDASASTSTPSWRSTSRTGSGPCSTRSPGWTSATPPTGSGTSCPGAWPRSSTT